MRGSFVARLTLDRVQLPVLPVVQLGAALTETAEHQGLATKDPELL